MWLISCLPTLVYLFLSSSKQLEKLILAATYSEFVFDPAKWPREQMDADFSKLAKMFNAMKSVVRVPDIDPKYKIAVLASKQVLIFKLLRAI